MTNITSIIKRERAWETERRGSLTRRKKNNSWCQKRGYS